MPYHVYELFCRKVWELFNNLACFIYSSEHNAHELHMHENDIGVERR